MDMNEIHELSTGHELHRCFYNGRRTFQSIPKQKKTVNIVQRHRGQCGVYQFLKLSRIPEKESMKECCYGLVIENAISSAALLTASSLPVSQDNLMVG